MIGKNAQEDCKAEEIYSQYSNSNDLEEERVKLYLIKTKHLRNSWPIFTLILDVRKLGLS